MATVTGVKKAGRPLDGVDLAREDDVLVSKAEGGGQGRGRLALDPGQREGHVAADGRHGQRGQHQQPGQGEPEPASPVPIGERRGRLRAVPWPF
ncbi:MAG: hypothetical protein M0Z94_02865 [Dehalococcoidales bacterium]|nr:hypothetical protein [Dehalococcoidales bacterium]